MPRRVTIPAGQFPDWAKTHRTLAQVDRTSALLAKMHAGHLLLNIEQCELSLLLDKARRNNPPEGDGSAAA